MAISGDLRTMNLVELFEWAKAHRKTGLLELERNRICRRLAFRDGQISACSSDDPSHLLGQFLLSQDKITPQTLRYALRQQADCGAPLGEILVDMGLLTAEDIQQQVDAKAEEMIYGLFAWEDAIFRFRRRIPSIPYEIAVELSTEEIIEKGAERFDELSLIRATFNSSGVVLSRTEEPLPSGLPRPRLVNKILEAINGQRTLGEILLHTHGSEFVVLEVLHMLYSKGLVEVIDERPVDPITPTLIDAGRSGLAAAPGQDPELASLIPEDMRAHVSGLTASGQDAGAEEAAAAEQAGLIASAAQLVADGELDEALEALDRCYSRCPEDTQVRDLITSTEAAYREQLRSRALAPESIPTRVGGGETPSNMHPADLFVYSLVDGKMNVQAFLWTAPLRELVVLRSLKRLAERGLIQIAEAPASRSAGPICFADLHDEVDTEAEIVNEEVGDDVDPVPDPALGSFDELTAAGAVEASELSD